MMKIRCENCHGVFEIGKRQAAEAVDGRVECRYCGAPVAAVGTEEPATADTEAKPEVSKPAEAPAAVEYEQLVADLCEPAVGSEPLPPVPQIRPRRPPEPKGRTLREPMPREPMLREPKAPEESAPAPPKEPARPGREVPSYNVSRAVVLDPSFLVESRAVAYFTEEPGIEPYRVLRTRILQAAEARGGNAVMITSALPLDGKTLTAVNLALTFSKAYQETALLVDGDLRQQRVHKMLGYEHPRGLGDYLTDGCPVSDMVVWPGVDNLTVISGGKTVSESSELLGSPLMKELVEDMKGRYPNRYVFFDVPPVLTGADALAFAPLVDHILFVVRAGVTPLPEVRRALSMLPREKVIGLVLNGQKDA